MKIIWRGKGIKEKGYDEKGKIIIECKKKYFTKGSLKNQINKTIIF